MKKEKYPEFLTMNQADNFPIFKTFWDSDTYKKDYKKACSYAKKINGQVYTATDEENKTIYIKGLHFVNRFGFCVLGVEKK